MPYISFFRGRLVPLVALGGISIVVAMPAPPTHAHDGVDHELEANEIAATATPRFGSAVSSPTSSKTATTSTTVPPTTALSTTLASSSASTSDNEELRRQDIELIQAVRRADLWESVAGQQAQQRSSNPVVREIAGHISEQHLELDKKVRAIAQELDVDLPTTPNAQQQAWLDELNNANGAQWDQIFVDRLRYAHGGVFQKIAEVRANTSNSAVRAFATDANTIVTHHMEYLESTKMVDYKSVFNDPAQSIATKNASSQSNQRSGIGTVVVIIGMGLALVLLMALLMRGTMK